MSQRTITILPNPFKKPGDSQSPTQTSKIWSGFWKKLPPAPDTEPGLWGRRHKIEPKTEPAGCTCDVRDLMLHGCKCGQMDRERGS